MKKAVPPILRLDFREGSITSTFSVPGQVIDATGEGKVAVFGADVDHYQKMPKAFRDKAHVYGCDDCKGPVFVGAEYRADDILALCSSCTEKRGFPLWLIGRLQDAFRDKETTS
jgi:hypothetical protein